MFEQSLECFSKMALFESHTTMLEMLIVPKMWLVLVYKLNIHVHLSKITFGSHLHGHQVVHI
jgi:hypothetical protein